MTVDHLIYERTKFVKVSADNLSVSMSNVNYYPIPAKVKLPVGTVYSDNLSTKTGIPEYTETNLTIHKVYEQPMTETVTKALVFNTSELGKILIYQFGSGDNTSYVKASDVQIISGGVTALYRLCSKLCTTFRRVVLA